MRCPLGLQTQPLVLLWFPSFIESLSAQSPVSVLCQPCAEPAAAAGCPQLALVIAVCRERPSP